MNDPSKSASLNPWFIEFLGFFLSEFIEMTRQSKAICRPNPAVGAILFKEGQVIGQGYTQQVGGKHAEVIAIESARKKKDIALSGSEMIVSLSPCCTQGRTPPCTDLIIESSIKRVYVLFQDPHDEMAVKTKTILKRGGVEYITLRSVLAKARTKTGEKVSEKQREEWMEKIRELFLLNLDYFYHEYFSDEKKPLVTLKYAMSMDGKMANAEGKSQWISSEGARELVHLDRAHHDAILVGARTFLQDDPLLTARNPLNLKKGKWRQPLPILLWDRSVKWKKIEKYQLIQNRERVLLVFFNGGKEVELFEKKLRRENSQKVVWNLPGKIHEKRAWKTFMAKLQEEENIRSLYVEGGAAVQHKFVHLGLTDLFTVYISPVWLGEDGVTPLTQRKKEGKKEGEKLGKKSDGFFPPRPLRLACHKMIGASPDLVNAHFWGVAEERIADLFEKVYS